MPECFDRREMIICECELALSSILFLLTCSGSKPGDGFCCDPKIFVADN
jgi:hypothetical protein